MNSIHRLFWLAAACGALAASAAAEDLVEFLSGAKARGSVKEIREDEKAIDFEVQIAGSTKLRTYKFSQVLAVTIDGKRRLLQAADGSSAETSSGAVDLQRSREQVLELINTVGRTPPEWLESTPLDYPETLEIDWPLKPTGPWNNQVNVGQFKWDVINPNPGRWRAGLRLLHQIMASHRDQPKLLERDMRMVGEMYFQMFQDYPRAAFWLRQAKVQPPLPASIDLAECYWRLGNQEMALEVLAAPRLPAKAIKLFGDLGETDRAIRLARSFERAYPNNLAQPLLLAGDACRRAGRFDEAIEFYQGVIDGRNAEGKPYAEFLVGRARESIDAIWLFDRTNLSAIGDGAFRATTTGYNGPVEVEVSVADGEIQEVRVVSHNEKQFYAALTDTPAQILDKQSVQDIDGTSGATITSQAIVNATARALASGAK